LAKLYTKWIFLWDIIYLKPPACYFPDTVAMTSVSNWSCFMVDMA